MARAAGGSIGVVETSEPESANIGSERPFSNPDVVLDVSGVGNVLTVLVAVLADITVLATPGKVLMGVHDNVLVVIVLEEVVPHASVP